MTVDREAQRVALALLGRGLVTVAEATALAGVSRQLMHAWIRSAGVQHERVREAVLARAWRKAMRNGPKLVEGEKSRRGA